MSAQTTVAMPATILVADDDQGILDMLKWELESRGHDVTLVANGSDAIEKLRTMEFDVVISDVRMPGASGIEVLEATKQAAADTEFVIATGHADLETAVACVRGGAFDLVQKPFDVDDLQMTVSRALERRQLLAETALYQASQPILAAKDPQQLPGLIVDVALKVMGADGVSLMLPGADNTLYVAELRSLTPEVRAAVITIGARLASRVANSRDPTLIENGLAADSGFSEVPSLHRRHSSILYPLTAHERLVAILNISRVINPRPFRKHDLKRAGILASQVLLALENRRLLQSVATSERLGALGQLASALASKVNDPITYLIANHSLLRHHLELLSHLDNLIADGAAIETLQRARQELGGRVFLAEFKQVLTEAEEGATRIRDGLRDLRSLGRIEEENLPVVDLNDAIRSALFVAAAKIGNQANITTRLGSNVDVFGTVGRFFQVFVNLLVNAAQAIGAEQHGQRVEIVVTSRREGDQVVAEVSDTGSGIRPETLPRVFEPFFTTKGSASGTGLGLSISRDIIRRCGGELKVESRPGHGATFLVELPAARPFPTQAADQGQSLESKEPLGPNRPLPSRHRILFVDDQRSLLRAYQRYFRHDYDVVLAPGGAEALEILAESPDFSLVVCDLIMPDVNGMDIYRRVAELYSQLSSRFLFVTGDVMEQPIREFVISVGVQILEKPFDFCRLREIIEARAIKPLTPTSSPRHPKAGRSHDSTTP